MTLENWVGFKKSNALLSNIKDMNYLWTRLTVVGIRYAEHATPSTRKGWH
jgi:hypothetical protein